jgi:four helix bundle protein
LRFAEWVNSVPTQISNDPIWKLQVYQPALFASEVAQRDAQSLAQKHLMRPISDQLYRAAASISANLTEGYSRSKAADRSRFYEYALGSARECRDWYYKARSALPEAVVNHRLELTASIVGMIASLISHQRTRAIRDARNAYEVAAQHEHALFDEDIPFA